MLPPNNPTFNSCSGSAETDNVKTGINSMINIGTIIGDNVFIGPGAMIIGEIKPKSKII